MVRGRVVFTVKLMYKGLMELKKTRYSSLVLAVRFRL
jgi:hypothetical protein